MQFNLLAGNPAKEIVIAVFAKVMKMTPAKQAEAGFSVSPKGGRTITQCQAPDGAIDGTSGQYIEAGTVVNFWQSGHDTQVVRTFVPKPASNKAKQESKMERMIRQAVEAALATK